MNKFIKLNGKIYPILNTQKTINNNQTNNNQINNNQINNNQINNNQINNNQTNNNQINNNQINNNQIINNQINNNQTNNNQTNNNQELNNNKIINNKIIKLIKLNRQKIINNQMNNIKSSIIDLSYIELNNYYNLYIENDILKNILNDNIKSYNFDYDPEKYFRGENNIYTRNIYENYNLIFMLNNIINKKIIGYCYKTKIKYECNGISYSKDINHLFNIIGYHFNNNDFIIYYVWEYYTPCAIFYPKQNIFYNISYRYNIIDINSLLNHYKNNYYIDSPGNIKYTLGIMGNAGHYFWNEIMGLMLLIKYDILKYIDNFIIYKYDYLNFGKILKEKFNKNITYFNDNNLNYYHVNITKHYISNDLINNFKNIFGIENIPYSLKNKREINILFDIRTNSRVCLNQEELIFDLINKLKINFPNIIFNYYISGIYRYNNNCLFDNEIKKQNDLIKILIGKFNNISNINIINLINKNLLDIIKICENIDIFILNIGSGIGFFCYILYNKLYFCLCNSHYIDACKEQHFAFEKYLQNCLFINKDYIYNKNINYDILSDYTIDIENTTRWIINNIYESLYK